MIFLKNLIKYTNANVVEATWLERTIAPDTEVPAVDAVIDEEGNVITEAVAAHTIPGAVTDVQLKCHSYSDGQIDMLRADVAEFGVPLSAEDEALIAEVIAARVIPPADYSPDLYDIEYLPKPPYVVYERKSDALVAQERQIKLNADSLAYLASTDWYVTRFAEVAVPIPPDVLEARAAARASIIKE